MQLHALLKIAWISIIGYQYERCFTLLAPTGALVVAPLPLFHITSSRSSKSLYNLLTLLKNLEHLCLYMCCQVNYKCWLMLIDSDWCWLMLTILLLLMLMQWPLAVTTGVTRVEAYHRPSAGCDGKAIIALNASSCRFNALNKKYIFLHRCNLSQMYQHNFGQLFAQKRFIDQNELNMTLQSDTQVIWCGSTCRFPLPWNGNPPVSARLLPIFPNIISWSSGEP